MPLTSKSSPQLRTYGRRSDHTGTKALLTLLQLFEQPKVPRYFCWHSEKGIMIPEDNDLQHKSSKSLIDPRGKAQVKLLLLLVETGKRLCGEVPQRQGKIPLTS